MKGVYKRGRIWYIDYYAGGRRIRERVGSNKRQAEIVLQKRKVEVAENKFLDVRKMQKVRFEELAQKYGSKIHRTLL